MLGLGNSLALGGAISSLTNTYSLDFDGTDDYVRVADHSSLDVTSAMSVSLWAKGAAASPTGNDAHISKYKSSNGNRSWTIAITNGRTVQMYLSGDGGSPATITTGVLAADLSGWNHYVYTFSSGTMKVYYNASEVATSGTPPEALYSAAADLVIGAEDDGTGGYFAGNIDEVAIWDVALDADAVSAIYNSGTPIALNADDGNYDNSGDLQGWWRMGDGAIDAFPLIGDETAATLTEKVTNGDASSGSPSPLTMDDGDGDAIAFTENNGTEVARYTTETSGVATSWKVTTETGGSYSDSVNIRILPNADGNYAGKAFYVSCKVYIPSGVGITSLTLRSIFAVTTAIDSTTTVGSWITLSGYTATTISGAGHIIDLTSNSTDNASANFLSTDWSIKLVGGNAGLMTNMVSGDIVEDTP